MRYILASIALVILLLPSLALGGEVTVDDLVQRNGLYYKKFTEVPFTGEVTGKSQGTLKKGRWYGPYVHYWDNGQLRMKATYKGGSAVGPWVSYHQNGQLELKGTFKGGKRVGIWVRYHDNGQLYFKGRYKAGQEDGPWVGYHDNGDVNKYRTGTYKNGVKVSD